MQYWKVEAAALKSQGKNTPFLGMELQGRVKYTLVNGDVVYNWLNIEPRGEIPLGPRSAGA